MASSNVQCPCCNLTFEVININSFGIRAVTCKYCEQEIEVFIEAQIFINLTKEFLMSDACLERREKAKPIVDNLYVLWLGVANIKNISKDRHDMYCSITGEGVANRLSGAKFFKTKKEANLFYKIYELKYKGLKVLQVKDLNMKTYHGRKGI